MNQQKLPLDAFDPAMDRILGMIDHHAHKAQGEIKERMEFLRRSLGQRTRRNIERIGK